jgi:hypothetical protein
MPAINRKSLTHFNIKLSLAAGAIMLATGLTSTVASAQTRMFTIYNDSSFRIDQLYVSPSGDNFWGADLLGNTVMDPSDGAPVAVAPGYYDVKLVDEDGDSCVVDNINFYVNRTWIMTDDSLISCELRSGE